MLSKKIINAGNTRYTNISSTHARVGPYVAYDGLVSIPNRQYLFAKSLYAHPVILESTVPRNDGHAHNAEGMFDESMIILATKTVAK